MKMSENFRQACTAICLLHLFCVLMLVNFLPCSAHRNGLLSRQRRQATISPQLMQQILSTAVAGVDYPNFTQIPKTAFTCAHQQPSHSKAVDIYYVDREAGCQVYHRCVNGQKFSVSHSADANVFNFLILTVNVFPAHSFFVQS